MGAHRKDFDVAVALYAEGYSIQDVADVHCMSRQAMHKILRRRGVEFRPQLRFGSDNHFYRGGSRKQNRARALVGLAVERGLLLRPSACESCGAEVSLEGHHDDYSKPLTVRWLCKSCHFEWHKHNAAVNETNVPPMPRADVEALRDAAVTAKRNGTPRPESPLLRGLL